MKPRVIFEHLELPALIDEKTGPLYRFAVLLTGDPAAAEQVLLEVCRECAPHVEAFRTESTGMAFVISKLRARCSKLPPATSVATGEKSGVAAQFHALAEPGRSALALFYLRIFPAHEIAAMLHITLEELASLLGRARDGLRAPPVAAA